MLYFIYKGSDNLAWSTPITDRTQVDIDNKTSKAFLNYQHMQEIVDNVIYLKDKLRSMGYYLTDFDKALDNLSYGYIPQESELLDLISHVNKLRNAFYVLNTTPATISTFDKLTFSMLNNFEQILQDLYTVIGYCETNYKYCDDFVCGGDI